MASLDVYCRISADREGGGLGVKRQEKDCRAHLAQLGHQVGEVLVDNDISGYKRKARPGYQALLDRVRAGTSDGFAVWHLDRLTRHPAELEEVIEAVEARKALVLTVTGGAYDLGTTDGRAMARVVGAFARKESEDKARRNARKHLELAQAGRPVGGTRHFGYDPIYLDGEPVLLDDEGHPTLRVRPDEAAQIREAIDALIAGESMRSITRRWNDAGITATRGGRMTSGTVRRILTSPTIAGWRSLGREPVARGTWEPIIDDELHAKVVAVVESRVTSPRRTLRTYLLAGMIRCSKCQRGLVSQVRYQAGGRRRSYTCSSDPSKDACGAVRIVAEETEAEVFERLVASLDLGKLGDTEAVDPTAPMLAELEQLEADQAQLARDYYSEKVIGRHQFFAASEALAGRISEVRARIATAAREQAQAPVLANPEALVAEWEHLDLGRQRAVLDRFIDHVVIHPASHRRGKFDRERVEVVWRR